MKAIKLIASLSLPVLALSSLSFSLTSCGNESDDPTPGPTPGPTPPEPEPEISFQVQFKNTDGKITISTTNGIVNKQFVAYLLFADGYKLDALTIRNNERQLNINSDYKYETSANKLIVYASAITSETLIITATAQIIGNYKAVIASDTEYALLMNEAFSTQADYISKVLVADTTKSISAVYVKMNGSTIPSNFDTYSQVLTVTKQYIKENCDLEVYIETIDRPHADFIFERTFSLMGRARVTITMEDRSGTKYTSSGIAAYSYGTAWIIDDATPEQEGDYNYYIGTNYHVTHGIDTTDQSTYKAMCKYWEEQGYRNFQYVSATYEYLIADDTISDPTTHICISDDYIPIKDVVKQEEKTILFNNEVSTEDNYYPCVDFYVYQANLQNDNTDISMKLDALNLQKKELGYITKFVAGNDPVISPKDKYIGGYPVREYDSIDGGVWTTHQINIDGQTVFGKCTHGDIHAHDIDDDPSFGREDIGAGVVYADTRDPEWMGGGASGSMILTKDYEISGIYWGHSYYPGDPESYMPLSTFLISTEAGKQYDFVSQFLTKK